MNYRKYINRRTLRIVLKSIGILIGAIILFVFVLFLLVYFGAFGPLPEKDELTAIRNEEASLVYSTDSVIIGKFFAENRTNIKWKQMPVHLKNALIATEDKRFFSHKGFDTRSYLRVLFRSIIFGDKSGGGGSTLTQQLVKNLFGREKGGFLNMPVTKIREMIIACRLEEVYSKEELLLLYLNSVPFGEDVFGVESASQRYFNKSASELKIEESAVLVGVLKANTYFNPRLNPGHSLARRNLILGLMVKEHYLSKKEADSLKKLPLGLNYENLNLKAPAGYFVYQVQRKAKEILDTLQTSSGKKYNLEKDGLKIYTTLDMKVQELSLNAIKKHLEQMQKLLDKDLENSKLKKKWYENEKEHSLHYDKDTLKRKVELFGWDSLQTKYINRYDSLWHYYRMLNASVFLTNPKNGAIISWIGGNYFRLLPFDMILSHRQIASAFKPILYATALETGISPCSYLKNEKVEYPGFEDWEPQNANLESTPDSTVAFWYALSQSMNLPTVELFLKTGADNLVSTCSKLHFPEISGDLPSVSIGTLDLSLFEIVRAYGAFANKGQMNEPYMIEKIVDANGTIIYSRKSQIPETIFSIETCQTISAILQEAINQGTGSRIRSQFGIKSELAGKTGTAQNYSNAWFIAYTPNLVAGVWVGASSPDMHFNNANGSGSALALPIIAELLKDIENDASLKHNYLTSFGFPEDVYSFLECDPFRQTGIRGFFNRLFSKKDKSDKDIDLDEKEKKESENKSLLKKLFKKEK